MKRAYPILAMILLFGMVSCHSKEEEPSDPETPSTAVLAFPNAAGGGRFTQGGRGTSILVVSSLEDNVDEPEAGTLRYALEQASGKRVIIFSVAGRIDLSFPITVKHGQVTILGQTAPGDGICISGFPVVIKADDVILRFLRFRMGDIKKAQGDALTVEAGHKDIIIDHCSFSWSTDECVSVYGVENFTLQYCFITESLNNSVHVKGAHGYGGIWGGKNATFHHNLLAHHNSRNPRFDHDYVTTTNVSPVDYINNVVYNWGSNSTYGGESSSKTGSQRKYNFINNYYKPGPSSTCPKRFLNPTGKCDNVEDGKHQGCIPSYGGTIVPGKFYLTGNYMYGNADVSSNNWSGVDPDKGISRETMISQCQSTSRFTFDNAYTSEQSALDAYDKVLAKAGCSLKRDAVDNRIVEDVKNGTGKLIDMPEDVGGWPTYSGSVTDSDHDGMPDEWEKSHGLDPNDRKDAVLTTLQAPYMNIEVYANDLVKNLY